MRNRASQPAFSFHIPERLTFRDAAYVVLGEVGEPMRAKEIVKEAIALGVLHTEGKTPHQTMKAKLSVDIRTNGSESRFKRTAPAMFGLRSWDDYQTYTPPRYRRLHKETVLAVEQGVAKELVPWSGIRYAPGVMGQLALRAQPLDRTFAETTEEYRQIVTLFAVIHDDEVLTFRRSRHQPESRLHGTVAVLFGGHAQPADFRHPLFATSDEEFIEMLSLRELHEELAVDGAWSLRPLGIIRDDSSVLGRQHLGFVSVLQTATRATVAQTSYAQDSRYVSVESVASEMALDRWSRIVLGFLGHCDTPE